MSYTPSSTSNTTNHRRTASAQHTRRESQLRHVINSSQSSHSHHSESSDSMTESEEHEMDPVQHRSHLDDDEETGLTSNVRRERSRRKRKNTGFDERVASSGESMLAMKEQSAEEASLTRRTLLYRILLNVMFIALWYTFSISISVYNKWMFSAAPPEDDPSNNPDGSPKKAVVFPFPLFTTCIHMLVQFSCASIILYFIPRLRPQQPANLYIAEGGEKQPLMTRFFYLTRIGPCGAATGLDIGLGNMSLKFISLTFYTMCKSSVLGFVLLFAFLFRLEKPSWRLFAIITTMTIGVLLMVAGEVSFSLLGFILVMSAAASSGFRWSLTQILLLRNPATSNPFSSIFFLAPVMFVTLLVIAIPVEGLPELRDAFYNLADAHGTGMSILILLFPGALAFCMTASEFALLQRTSVVTLSIAGIFKEVLTISTASIVFGDDKLTPINLAGLVITILTIAYYNYVKISRMQEEAKMEAQLAVHGAAGDANGQAYAPVLSADPDTGSGAGIGRQSTSDLIRNSLSISTSGDYSKGSKKSRPETPPRISPVKRPEDLD